MIENAISTPGSLYLIDRPSCGSCKSLTPLYCGMTGITKKVSCNDPGREGRLGRRTLIDRGGRVRKVILPGCAFFSKRASSSLSGVSECMTQVVPFAKPLEGEMLLCMIHGAP